MLLGNNNLIFYESELQSNGQMTFQIASLLAGVEYGKSVFVPSQGWAVFGQLGNSLNKSQLLPTLDGEWTEGPELMNSFAHSERQCMFEVKIS